MINTPNVSPVVSVVVPARNCREDLRQCLQSLDRSRFRDFEVIVVDDASTDDTTSWIDPSQARVVVLPVQSGPAAARNRGAALAKGEYLLFVDADVCVHPDTVGRVAEVLSASPDLAAVFGSYDTEPQALNVLSQYRNLMHHFVHQDGSEEASTFWAGCGAVRRSVFEEVGGFHTDYRRPCIEDIELGVRLRKAGHRIGLHKRILVTHLKRWTLFGMLKTDIRDRALPWSQLILREKSLPNDLNLSLSHRVGALLACGLLGTFLAAAFHLQILLALPIVFLIAVALIDGWSLKHRVPTTLRIISVLTILACTGFLAFYFKALMLIPLALLTGIVAINWRFYVFLARNRHPFYGILAVPLFILYYIYSSVTFLVAFALHLFAFAPAGERPFLSKNPSARSPLDLAPGDTVPVILK